eukprot:7071936-Prymnesium_polylepis.1
MLALPSEDSCAAAALSAFRRLGAGSAGALGLALVPLVLTARAGGAVAPPSACSERFRFRSSIASIAFAWSTFF